MNKNTVLKVKNYLEGKGIIVLADESNKMSQRANGKKFSTEEHLQGMIYSFLSAQTVWANIERNMKSIDNLFFHYDAEEILKHDYSYFVNGLARLHCRSRLTNNQMKVLHENINTVQRIISEYGSMDAFVTSAPQTEIVAKLSDSHSKYKIKQMGEALAWEYLRNVGVDGAKPDVHMKRLLGAERLGYSKNVEASNEEVLSAMKELSDASGFWMADIDYMFWAYCATDKGEICTANPACSKCVIRDECNKQK